jgi:acyl-coenzyme A synthetase/AMP-(fatty) acid ligase
MKHIAGELAYRGLLLAGAKPVLTTQDGETRSGHELIERVASLAGQLGASGLRRRRVGLWYWNGAAAVEAFLAVEWIGATRIALDPGLPVKEALAFFAAAKVDAILADPEHAALLGHPVVLVHSESSPLGGPAVLPSEEVCHEPCIFYPRRRVDGGDHVLSELERGAANKHRPVQVRRLWPLPSGGRPVPHNAADRAWHGNAGNLPFHVPWASSGHDASV